MTENIYCLALRAISNRPLATRNSPTSIATWNGFTLSRSPRTPRIRSRRKAMKSAKPRKNARKKKQKKLKKKSRRRAQARRNRKRNQRKPLWSKWTRTASRIASWVWKSRPEIIATSGCSMTVASSTSAARPQMKSAKRKKTYSAKETGNRTCAFTTSMTAKRPCSETRTITRLRSTVKRCW